MRISIVTPTSNSAATILETCRSITGQNYPDFEHIIVDNLSKDRTGELVREHYRECGKEKCLKIVSESDRGISDAFNKGIKASTGEIVAILNSDDSYHSLKVFEAVSGIFLTHPEVDIIHGKMFFEDKRHGTNIRAPLLCKIQAAMPLNHPTMFVRKSLYGKYGFFDLDYQYAMDFEWLCRFYECLDPTHLFYFKDFPITTMKSGGASHRRELQAIHETKRALLQHSLFDGLACYHYLLRLARTHAKRGLGFLNIDVIVKVWRFLKWKE